MKKLLMAAMFVLILSTFVQATSLEVYSFSGTITSSNYEQAGGFSEFGKGITVGDTFAGSFTWIYDPSLKNELPSDAYYDGIHFVKSSLFITFDGSTIQNQLGSYLLLINKADRDELSFFHQVYTWNGIVNEDLFLTFISSDGAALPGSGGLPASINSLGLDDGNLSLVLWALDGSTGSYSATGYFDQFCTVSYTSPVPEPATMILFGTGIIGLLGFSRRKRR